MDPLDGVVPRRLLQALIDVGGLFVVFFVLLNVGVFSGHEAWLWVAFAVLIAGPFLVHVVLAARSGATPGMRLTGLRIVTTAGTTPGLGAYLVRWLLMIADGALFGVVGLVVVLATPRRQRLGDLVAGTLVVRAEALPPEPGPAVIAPAGAATPR